MTIKMRILIPMIVFTVVASSAILISNIVQFSQYVGADISNRLNTAALTALSKIDSLKSQTTTTSLYLAKDATIIKALENSNNDILFERATQLYSDARMEFCTITDASGIILACTHNLNSHGLDASEVPSVKTALGGKPITTIEQGISIGLSVCSSTPIYNEQGKLLGSITVGYPMGTSYFVDSIKSITGCEVTICQEDVRISTTLTHENGTRAIGTQAPAEISRTVLSGDTYRGRAEILYNDMIAEWHPIFGADAKTVGILFVGHYTTEEANTVWAFVKMGLLFMAFFTAAFSLIIMYMSEHIAMPINEAVGVLSQISKGNFDVRVRGDYTGDLALIKDSVNNTAIELSNYLNEKIQAEHLAHESELAKARAEQASIIKSEFLASVSHEIRTPMNAIIGMSELLFMEQLNDRQHGYVKDIKTSSTALLGIINDILDMSKIEAGKLTLAPIHFEFPSLIESISSMMAYSAKNKGLDFLLEAQTPLPGCLYGDDIRLRQILVNLLGNAIKFTEMGFVRFTAKYSDGIVCFSVEDTGIGIKESDLKSLYDSFKQFDSLKNRDKRGTGLGLAITKSLVDMMGGKILVHSVYGKGSTFNVELPVPLGDESQIATDSSPIEFLSAPDAKILIVDDDEINRNVGSGLLKLNGIDCDTACNGFEAIQKVKEKDYDLVFMDHMMPVMDGVEAMTKIKELESKYKQPVIIAFSANATAEARKLFINSGVSDFLAKPVEKSQLVQMLKKWLPPEKVHESPGYRVLSDSKGFENGKIVSKLRQLSSLDVNSGLALMGGSETMYENTLQIIAKRIPEALQTMAAFLENGQLDRFAIDAHGIRSSLATAGADSLSKQAHCLELKAKEGNVDFCNEMFQGFSKELLALHKVLFELLPTKEQTPLFKGDLHMLRDRLDEIRRCIEEFDDEAALEILASLAEFEFGEQINKLLKELGRQVEMFEYESACETLDCLGQYL